MLLPWLFKAVIFLLYFGFPYATPSLLSGGGEGDTQHNAENCQETKMFCFHINSFYMDCSHFLLSIGGELVLAGRML